MIMKTSAILVLTVITGFYSVLSLLIWFMVIYIFMIYVKSE